MRPILECHLVPNTVFALILCIAQYAAVHYIMKEKINLI